MSAAKSLWEDWPAAPTPPLKDSFMGLYKEDAKSDMVMSEAMFRCMQMDGILVNVDRKDVREAVAKGKQYLDPIMAKALELRTALMKVRKYQAVFIGGGPVVKAYRDKIKPIADGMNAGMGLIVNAEGASEKTMETLKTGLAEKGADLAVLTGKQMSNTSKELQALVEIAAAAIATDYGMSQIAYLHLTG
jgi:hypothetical protein